MDHVEEEVLDAERVRRWREERLARDYERVAPRREQPTTLSGIPIDDVYTPADVEGIDPLRDIGLPGEYPYTRGPHASMYRGRPWTIRQVAGFGQAEDTNGRFKYLLAHGETGLSTDFDLPIATTVATEGTGVEELRALFDARWSTLGGNGDLAGLRHRKRAREAALIAEAFTRACAEQVSDPSPDLNTAVKEILEEAARRWTT